MSLEVVLVEWAAGRTSGPRVLGQVTEPEIVARVREIVAAEHRRELARLTPPVRALKKTAGHEPSGEQREPAAATRFCTPREPAS